MNFLSKGYEISDLAMKFSHTFLSGVLFAGLLVISFAFHSSSALEESRGGKDQNSIGGMNIAEKRRQPLRERRAVKKNSTEDILERLQDLEKK